MSLLTSGSKTIAVDMFPYRKYIVQGSEISSLEISGKILASINLELRNSRKSEKSTTGKLQKNKFTKIWEKRERNQKMFTPVI